MKHFSHLIIGTGQALGTLLGKLIPSEETIGVIEANKVGGSCVNYGCTPTKTLVASAKAYHMAKRGDFYGFQSDNLKLNFERVRKRMNEIRNGGSDGLTNWMKDTENVDLIFGKASFTGNKKIKVNDEEYSADNIYINVGTRAKTPQVEGLSKINWLDSARLLALKQVPEHLLIIGGGYIGVEFAQIFRRFGAKVSIIQRSDQLVPREDSDIAESIKSFLEEEGIDVYLNTEAGSLEKKGDHIEILIKNEGKGQKLTGDQLLVAAGRIPNSDRLNLDNTDIKTNSQGFIEVDDFCQTGVEGVFGIGDVNGHGGFTHTAVNDAEIVLDKLYGGDRTLERNTIYGLFTDPPLGRVGLTEKEALEKGLKVLKATKPMKNISRAKEMGETKGFAKLLVDPETDLILGASILGVGGDEIINMFASIMHSNIPCRHYRKVMLVHPTVSELMPWVLDGLEEVSDQKNSR